MFDELSEKLEATFARLRGRGVLTDADIKEGLREVRRVLLEADVNFQLTREFLERVEKKAVGVSALRTVQPAQQLVKIVHDELAAMLGEHREGLKLSSVPPTIVITTRPLSSFAGSVSPVRKGSMSMTVKSAHRPGSSVPVTCSRNIAYDAHTVQPRSASSIVIFSSGRQPLAGWPFRS